MKVLIRFFMYLHILTYISAGCEYVMYIILAALGVVVREDFIVIGFQGHNEACGLNVPPTYYIQHTSHPP